MNYDLLKDTIDLIAEFDLACQEPSFDYTHDIKGFKRWILDHHASQESLPKHDWEGKDKGRSAESVISTLLVHLNRYAKSYSKAAIYASDFSTQEEFIYLINLKAFGEMTKKELIRKNIQDKPSGMQIISRLIKQGWVAQETSQADKRSRIIKITSVGENVLDQQMDKIRTATNIVSGNLTPLEKMELIGLLHKLDQFHHSIFCENIPSSELLDKVSERYRFLQN